MAYQLTQAADPAEWSANIVAMMAEGVFAPGAVVLNGDRVVRDGLLAAAGAISPAEVPAGLMPRWLAEVVPLLEIGIGNASRAAGWALKLAPLLCDRHFNTSVTEHLRSATLEPMLEGTNLELPDRSEQTSDRSMAEAVFIATQANTENWRVAAAGVIAAFSDETED